MECNGRECGHKIRKKSKGFNKDIIQEEPEDESGEEMPEVNVLVLPEKPSTSQSRYRPVSGISSLSLSRPGSSYSRPGTAGSKGLGRKTVSRASSRKSRLSSANQGDKGQSSDSESDNEDGRTRPRRRTMSDADFPTVDISDDKAFDTDLEVEELPSVYDHTGKTAYTEGCKKLGVVPASYFLRHMHDRKLSLKHHGLGATGMKAVAVSLVSNTEVLQLDLSDNWLGLKGGTAVCDMLRENCFITHLDLSENRLGPGCAPHLSQIIQQNVTVTHLILKGNDFEDTAAVHFAEAIHNTNRLEYLDLSHNHFGEKAGVALGPAISENLSIKELDLSWNCLRRKGAVAVALGIKQNVFMKRINLSWNGFGLEGSFALGDALKGNSVLEELYIVNNRITTEGAVLIGKGLSVNETLKVLKMGKNPMQTGGCYGICAAILRNPNCVIKHLDFSDVLVNQDFKDMFKEVQQQMPDLQMLHGGMEPPQKPKSRLHPMLKLSNFIEKNNLRLVDFFDKFDKDRSMMVSHEEFVQGLECAKMALLKYGKETGIHLTQDEIKLLLDELDKDQDGEINYSELVLGHQSFQERTGKINAILTVTQPRPLTT